jgi:hypothetical protein
VLFSKDFYRNSLTNKVFERIVLGRTRLLRPVIFRTMRNNTMRLTMLAVMCALVFVFALRAKTSVYNNGAPPKITPATSSKLWLGGQKMEVQQSVTNTNNTTLFWMAALCLFSLFFRREPRVRSVFVTPPPDNLSRRYAHRFLRPPPYQA